MTYLVSAQFPNQVSTDPSGHSIIAGHSFSVSASVTDASGNPIPNETVYVYAFDIHTGASILLGEGTTNYGGTVGISCSALNNTANNQSSRLIRVKDAHGDYTDYTIPIWFNVTMTLDCDTTLSCSGSHPSNFYALPSTTLACGQQIYVYTTAKGIRTTSSLWDRGPGSTSDPYWNGSGVPQYHAGLDASQGLWSALGFQDGVDYSCSGAYGTVGSYWRFV